MATRQRRDDRVLRETGMDPGSDRARSRTRPVLSDLELPLEGFERPAVRSRGSTVDRERERDVPTVVAKRSASAPRQAPPEPRRSASRQPAPEPRRPARRPARREPVGAAIEFERDPRPRTGLPRRQQILLPLIALIATGAGAVAAIAVTNEPQTNALRQEVSSLQSQIASARQQLTTLQHADASSSEVSHLSRTVAGLGRTVGGLQGSVTPLKVRVDGLSVCLPQLQGELTGLGVHGSGKRASLVNSASVSPGCAALLSGG